ncbi:transcription factor with AP2 domain(s), putative [Plasmodium vinckei]|uniref:Transcription factor with AP2 domain(S), putative n=1 Tax=Plasmodium vinckei TaxID=5860 RepID=A0A6V7SV62_PLAVN|nr:transcription factor with AP2 domain(s), putative [Plasmodium vinckei]
MFSLRSSSNTNKKIIQADEKEKSENINYEKTAYTEESLSKIDNYVKYSDQQNNNYPISRTTTPHLINIESIETVNGRSFNNIAKAVTLSNDDDNFKQITESDECNTEEYTNKDIAKALNKKYDSINDSASFESIKMETHEIRHNNESKDNFNNDNNDDKYYLNIKKNLENDQLKEGTEEDDENGSIYATDEKNIYMKSRINKKSHFNENVNNNKNINNPMGSGKIINDMINNTGNSVNTSENSDNSDIHNNESINNNSNDNICEHDDRMAYLKKLRYEENSKENFDENYANPNEDYGYDKKKDKYEKFVFQEKESGNSMGHDDIDNINNDDSENNIKLKEYLIKGIMSKKTNAENGSINQNKALALMDNILNIKNNDNNDSGLNFPLRKCYNDDRKDLIDKYTYSMMGYNNMPYNDINNCNGNVNNKIHCNSNHRDHNNCDHHRCFINNISMKESINKNEYIKKVKVICLSYLRILKRLVTAWSETNKSFEYHFINILNNVEPNNLEIYLCCFSNIKICSIKSIFMYSIIECIEELEIIKHFKMLQNKEDASSDKNNTTNNASTANTMLDKSELHKRIIEEVEKNLTKEIVDEMHELALRNPYFSTSYYLNSQNNADEKASTILSLYNSGYKNNIHAFNDITQGFDDFKRGKDILHCNHSSDNNYGAVRNSCGCNHDNLNNYGCADSLPINYASNILYNYLNNNNANNKNGLSNNHQHNRNGHSSLSNANNNYNSSYNVSNCKTKKNSYSNQNILNKLNVSIDYNSFNDYNNNYIQEAEKVVEKYKNFNKMNSKDSDNIYSACNYSTGATDLNNHGNNNANAIKHFKMLLSEYANACKNEKVRPKGMDINPVDLNLLKSFYSRLNPSGSLEEKDHHHDKSSEDIDLKDIKGYFENKHKMEHDRSIDLNKYTDDSRFAEDGNYNERDNYGKFDKDQGDTNGNENNYSFLSNIIQNMLFKKRKQDVLYPSSKGNNDNNSYNDLNYLLRNSNVLKKFKLNMMENKKDSGYNKNGNNSMNADNNGKEYLRKKDMNDIGMNDNNNGGHGYNSRKNSSYKNNGKSFKDLLNLSQESLNKKGNNELSGFKNGSEYISSNALYDFIMSTNNSNNLLENSLQHGNIINNINSSNGNNSNNLNGMGYRYNYNSKKNNNYDYNTDYNSKISVDGSELSLSNNDNNDLIMSIGGGRSENMNEGEHVSGYKTRRLDMNKNASSGNNYGNNNGSYNNKGGKILKQSSTIGSSVNNANYANGKLKYEMPAGVNPNDDKVKGVYFSKSPRGVGKWNAYFQIANNKRLFTSFSVSKYGYNEARKLSILKRTEWEKEYKHQTDLKNADAKKGKKKSNIVSNNLSKNNGKNMGIKGGNNSNSDDSICYTKEGKLKDDGLLYSNDDEDDDNTCLMNSKLSNAIGKGLMGDSEKKMSKLSHMDINGKGNNGVDNMLDRDSYLRVDNDNINFFIDNDKNDDAFNTIDLIRSSLSVENNGNNHNSPSKNSINYPSNSLIMNSYNNNIMDGKQSLNASRILSNSLGFSNKYARNS